MTYTKMTYFNHILSKDNIYWKLDKIIPSDVLNIIKSKMDLLDYVAIKCNGNDMFYKELHKWMEYNMCKLNCIEFEDYTYSALTGCVHATILTYKTVKNTTRDIYHITDVTLTYINGNSYHVVLISMNAYDDSQNRITFE